MFLAGFRRVRRALRGSVSLRDGEETSGSSGRDLKARGSCHCALPMDPCWCMKTPDRAPAFLRPPRASLSVPPEKLLCLNSYPEGAVSPAFAKTLLAAPLGPRPRLIAPKGRLAPATCLPSEPPAQRSRHLAIGHIFGHVPEFFRKTPEYPGFESRRLDETRPSKQSEWSYRRIGVWSLTLTADDCRLNRR
jgi:hypothetical protein